jgi:large subunit ribosomal protein L9
MEVILLKDVQKLGRRGDVKHVSDGYAQNLLFPRGLAEKATPAKIALLKAHSAEHAAAAAAEQDAQVAKVKAADGQRFEISAKADKLGHLYQKIDADRIAEAVGVPAIAIKLEAPLKEAGEHRIPLVLGKANATAIVVISAA